MLSHLNVLFLASDVKDLGDLLVSVRPGGNNQRAVKQIDGETVRRLVVGASNLGDTAVSGHDHHGSLVGLESTIEEGEAFDIEHVDLVDEKDTRHDLSTALLTPFGNLLVDLFADFWLDFANVSGK